MLEMKWLSEHPSIGQFHANENEGEISLDLIADVIKQRATNEYGLDVSVSKDEIKMGSVFRSTKQECIIIKNNQHPKYMEYVITVRRQGAIAFISTYVFGIGENPMEPSGGLVSGIIHSIKGTAEKRQAEIDYYGIMNQCILSVMHG